MARTRRSLPSEPAVKRAFAANTTVWVSPAGGDAAGGDWCDVLTLADGAIALTVGDVCGHGAEVSATMSKMRAAIVRAVADSRDPAALLAIINAVACGEGEGSIVTAIIAFLDCREQTMTFANAGHPPPLLLSQRRHVFLEHPPADLPLGVFPDYHAANYVVAIPVDALVVFYTDGITEHDRDPIRGETELTLAAQRVFDRPEFDDAQAIAHAVLRTGRGDDDAATMVLRTTPA